MNKSTLKLRLISKKMNFCVSIFLSLALLFQTALFSEGDVSQIDQETISLKVDQELQKQVDHIASEVGKEQDNFDQQVFDVSFFNKPQKMLEKLPEQGRKNVSAAWEAWGQLRVSGQNPLSFLFEIIFRLKMKSLELVEKKGLESSQAESFLGVLAKAEDFFNDPNNIFALQLGIVDKSLGENLKEISAELSNFLHIAHNMEDHDFNNDLGILHKSIEGLKNQKLDLLIENHIKYLTSLCQEVLEKISKAQEGLEELDTSSYDDGNKDLKEAIDFWKDTLKELRKGTSEELRALQGVFGQGSADQPKIFTYLHALEKSAPFAIPVYAFYRKCMELYRLDPLNKDNLTLTWANLPLLLIDQVFRVSIIPLYFLKRVMEVSRSNINPIVKQNLLQSVLFESLWVYSDPNFYVRGQMWPVRALYRIAPASLYHYIFHKGKKSENEQESISECEPFKQALWFSLRDGYRSFADFVDGALQKKLGPQKLEILKKNSLGIIKPGLMRFILDTSMPVLAQKGTQKYTKDFFALTKKNVFQREYGDWSDFWDWNYVGNTDFEKISSSEFIEGRVIGYLAMSLGTHFGKVFTRANRRGIRSLVSKATNGVCKILEKVGLVAAEPSNWFEELRQDIKDELAELFSDAHDPFLIMGRKIFFSLLLQLGMIDENVVSKIEEEIAQEQLDEKLLEEIADKIITTITDNMLIWAGGFVGSCVSWYTADYLMKKYGPFYPKLKAKFAGSI